MKQKKITVIISYSHAVRNTVRNERVAERIKRDLLKGSDPRHEKIESVIVEDIALFGSKCLPDNVATSEPNVESLQDNVDCLEPKPAEPKFTKESMVHCKSFGYEGDYKVLDYSGGPSKCYDCIDRNGYHFRFYESDLESHTELQENIAENRNLPQNCDKQFDTILKDSFSKERRLNIAARMMQGLICAPLIPGVDPNPPAEYLAQTAFRLADALIAEAEKGGDK